MISKIWLKIRGPYFLHPALIAVFFSTLVFPFLFSRQTFATDWKIYAGTDEGLFYYDEDSITHPSAGVVHFRHKAVFSERGITRVMEALGQEYKNLAYSISVREMNCSEKKIRSLGVTYFSKEGRTLDVAIDAKSEWHAIEPQAMVEGLFQKLCISK